ncbi:PaaI family thioesterase [candidate division CSSED10-310 bacterium]|uniref:PaaI family thioesterase n=1 Tax=candidate division CSSED10-310 bacterium TaxID=2855610 RepID=A0ABV6Z5J7_UNCC1
MATSRAEHFRKLERMYAAAPINVLYAAKLTISEGLAELVIPVKNDFFHAAGAVHGSVYFKALDDAAYFAVNSLDTENFVLTVSFTVYFIKPITAGEMRASGKVVSRTSRLFFAEAHLTDAAGNEIGRGSGTFIRSGRSLSVDIGYQ